MRDYGWTLAEVDGLEDDQRLRIARIWAVEALAREGETYLAKWRQAQTRAAQTFAMVATRQGPGHGGGEQEGGG
jgi:hypothetical protein